MEHASGLEKRGSRVRSELSKHPAKVQVLSLSTDGALRSLQWVITRLCGKNSSREILR